LTSIAIPPSVTSIGSIAFTGSGLNTVYIENDQLGIPSPHTDTDVSFFGATVNTLTYQYYLAYQAGLIAEALLTDSTFITDLSNIGITNQSDMTNIFNVSDANDTGKTYNGVITIPHGNFSDLSDENKTDLISRIKTYYASALSIVEGRVLVTLSSGSIVANVEVYNTEAEAYAASPEGIAAAAAAAAATPICFPAGTPVTTDQGDIAIEKLNVDKHTIRGKEIVAITQSRPLHEYIVSIEKDALGKNVPSQTTEISKEHKVFYKGEMIKAKDLVDMCEGAIKIPYNGATLYNVLLKKHDKMMVNNLICETLHPNNIMAKICGGKFGTSEKNRLISEVSQIIRSNDVPAYKKLYASLK